MKVCLVDGSYLENPVNMESEKDINNKDDRIQKTNLHSASQTLSADLKIDRTKRKRQRDNVAGEDIDWEKRCREIVADFQKTIKSNQATTKKKRPILDEAIRQNSLKQETQHENAKAERETLVMSQSDQWHSSFRKLILFRQRHGHCLVPCIFDDDPALARWVKRQRYQYYLLINGKKSSMKKVRIKMLNDIGFIWDAQEALWQERFRELLNFKRANGHCAVPTMYAPNQQLATWVKFQRRQYRLYQEERPSFITAERIKVLEKHGFEWKLRSSSSPKKKSVTKKDR